MQRSGKRSNFIRYESRSAPGRQQDTGSIGDTGNVSDHSKLEQFRTGGCQCGRWEDYRSDTGACYLCTATATDALGNRVKASCDVTVTEQPYNVEVYVPKGILAANGLKFAPSAGLDEAGHDIFDTEQVIADVSADTELNNAYDVYTMTLYPGTYSHRAVSAEGRSLGGGAFTFPDSQTSAMDGHTIRAYLRLAEVSVTDEFDGQQANANDFSGQLTNEVSTATIGDSYENAGGYAVYPALLSASDTISYYLAVTPSDAYVKAHNVMAGKNAGCGSCKRSFGTGRLLNTEFKAGALTINAPADADVAICEQY